MKKKDVQRLDHGIYRLHWKDGGCSLAAVGSLADGSRWMAPTNWISGSCASRDVWRMVKRAERI